MLQREERVLSAASTSARLMPSVESSPPMTDLSISCSNQSRLGQEDLRGTPGEACDLTLRARDLPWPFQVQPEDATRVLLYRPLAGCVGEVPDLYWSHRDRRLTSEAGGTVKQFIGVCSHGRHDACCGRRGRALLQRLSDLGMGATSWAVSHIGGDRFAANLILLPSGYIIGRADDLADHDLVALSHGKLPLTHLRGRWGQRPVEAVLEQWYRSTHNLTDIPDEPEIQIADADSGDGVYNVTFNGTHLRLKAVLNESSTEIHYTCNTANPQPIYSWTVHPLR